MSTDYGYINARVRGMKAKLLGSEFYADVLAGSDFRAFTSALSQSVYVRDLEEAQSRFEGLKAVDRALAANFYRTTRSILTFSDGTPGQLVELLLLRYDLDNIKAIARAKHAGRDLEEIRSALFPAGSLKPAVLETVATAADMASVAQALAVTSTALRGAFARAAAKYQSDGSLYELEVALDRAYFKILLGALKGLSAPAGFVRHVRREVDATNLRTALKLRGRGSRPDELFIPGGREIQRNAFDGLLADESKSALQVLSGTGFAAVADTDSLPEAEEAIRTVLARSGRRLAADPLAIGVVVDFLRAKETETARLRLLARGKFYGVPRDALEKELGHG